MDTTLLIAIIGAIATILSALITKWAEIRGRERTWLQLSPDSKNAFGGVWVGGGVQRKLRRKGKLRKNVVLGTKLTLDAKSNKSIFGEKSIAVEYLYWLKESNGTLTEGRLIGNGKFRKSRFFEIECVNQDETVSNFGHFLLELSADGKRLDGEFLAYGRSGDIMTGVVHFEKPDDFGNSPISKKEFLKKIEPDIDKYPVDKFFFQ